MSDSPSRRIKTLFRHYWKVLLLWGIILTGILVALNFGIDTKVIAIATIFLGVVTKAFAGLAAIVLLIPVVGPFIVKLFAIPLFWILNALGYFVSVIAIKKGYTKEMMQTKVLTIALMVGILLGYILGHLIPIR
ncbi:MAG: hypothetical protein V3U24_04125 [Candidatus Neomarinimicrobiota bacterium]